MAKKNKDRAKPTPEQIKATAEILSAYYQREMPEGVALHSYAQHGTESIGVSYAGQNASVLMIDGDGVTAFRDKQRSKIIARSLRNTMDLVNEARPYFKAAVDTVMNRDARVLASQAGDRIVSAIHVEHGRSDEEWTLPLSIQADIDQTVIIIRVPNARVAPMEPRLREVLATLLDLVEPRGGKE